MPTSKKHTSTVWMKAEIASEGGEHIWGLLSRFPSLRLLPLTSGISTGPDQPKQPGLLMALGGTILGHVFTMLAVLRIVASMALGSFTTNEAAEEEPANALIAGAQELVPGQEDPADEVPSDVHRLHRDWLVLGGPVAELY